MTWGILRRRLRRTPRVVEAAEAYAQWAPRYPPWAHNRLMEVEERALLELLPDVRGLTALDLGCGTGRYTRWLQASGAARVVGVDRSPDMLRRAREQSRCLVRADARALPLASASVDLVVSGLVVGDFAEIETALADVARVLRPRGHLVYSDLHPSGARAGWLRTFEAADGTTLAVRHHLHRLGDHVLACYRAGLEVESVAEPPIDFDHPERGRPALVVIRARRP
jgi:malonyl-CoA O-methyltransferase